MTNPPLVKPRPVSGFPEWLPEEKLVEERLLTIVRRQFALFGFTPIETPAVERQEILTAKGVVDKEIYALARLAAGAGEDPATELALHFDLTVPTARYVAQHFNRLTFPFRRYQIQKVWRGERPQAGRFREFYQCDIDIIGNGSLNLLADAEIPCVIHAIFSEMAIGAFVVRLNNRKIVEGLLEDAGVPAERTGDGLRLIDALEKVGEAQVAADLVDRLGIPAEKANTLMRRLERDAGLTELEAQAARGGSALFGEGVRELGEVVRGMHAFGMPPDGYRIDLSIARGLDYYTGTVYETQLLDQPSIGSICSGGRYDDLASNYTKQKLPGVGISIGLTRLLARLFEADVLKPGPATAARALVTVMDRAHLDAYLAMAADLRTAGITTEVFTEDRRLGAQLRYADAKGFAVAVIAGADEFASGTVMVKTLATAEQVPVPRRDLVSAVEARLGPA